MDIQLFRRPIQKASRVTSEAGGLAVLLYRCGSWAYSDNATKDLIEVTVLVEMLKD
jgi:hypothetical protein